MPLDLTPTTADSLRGLALRLASGVSQPAPDMGATVNIHAALLLLEAVQPLLTGAEAALVRELRELLRVSPVDFDGMAGQWDEMTRICRVASDDAEECERECAA